MVIGIGIDRVTIARVERAIDRFGSRFLDRIYTDIECQQAKERGNPARRLAMLFAAKEAVAKALGTGFRQGVTPTSIETIHQRSGKPVVQLHGGAAAAARQQNISYIHISLTDEDGVAIALSIAESDG
ncbi:MAG: holo-ACP synthase [Mariprofundales bacterium]|nr:holo-ACP synthase [Mariprofundales bacterium]